ncbi:MAG: hypothetical protein JWP75_802 [Frondihabitans sp.]|nr:hypothetical protein [Frondihabitans sp.]
MKIVLFTPTHQRSAIARVSVLLRDALEAEQHVVVIVATEDEVLTPSVRRPRLADAVDWRDQTAVRDLVWESDLVFHQIGNHFGYHSGSVFWIPLIGGFVALHDFFLGDLFLLWAEHNSAEADGILHRWYDLDIGTFRTAAHSGHFAELDAPLTEWLTDRADAVIAHSDFGLGPVRRATDAPIRVLPLPYSPEAPPAGEAPPAWDIAATNGDERFTILTFGHIIPNKLCEDVIAAVAGSAVVRQRIQFRICGEISDSYRNDLESFAEAIGVHVVITGALTDLELRRELQSANLVVCARNPTLESGSASAIESLLSGTPLVVINTGFYASLPSDIVFRVPLDDFQSSLTRTLRSIVRGDFDLAARAEAGIIFAQTTFRADSYAEALVGLAAQAAEHRLLREVDDTFDQLRTGPTEVARLYAKDSAILRADFSLDS